MFPTKSNFHSFTKDEIMVAQILSNLPNIFTPPGPSWACKRRRSIPPESEPQSCNRRTIPTGETHFKSKAKSPVSPLSLPSSETETVEAVLVPTRKPNGRRGPKKKTLEELKDLVAKLSTEQGKLKSKSEEVIKFYGTLKSLILRFKSHKSQLGIFKKREELVDVAVNGSIPSTNLALVLKTETETSLNPLEQYLVPQLSIENSPCSLALVSRTPHSAVPDYTCSSGLGFLSFDVTNKNAIFAQARKMRKERMVFNRIKS